MAQHCTGSPLRLIDNRCALDMGPISAYSKSHSLRNATRVTLPPTSQDDDDEVIGHSFKLTAAY